LKKRRNNRRISIDKIGEFELLNKLLKIYSTSSSEVIIGTGDDSAVVKIKNGKFLVATTDSFVEDVHFTSSFFSPRDIAWKALTAAVSDIAAIGGQPKFGLISLGLRKKTGVSWVEELNLGLKEGARKYNISIIGGDIVNSPSAIVISVTLLGEIEKGKILSRQGARPQDVICVTGSVGGSYIGLKFLKGEIKDGEEKVKKYFIRKHLRPRARLAEGKFLAQTRAARCAIDLSDGLLKSAEILAEVNKVDLKIYLEKLPTPKFFRQLAPYLSPPLFKYPLIGGEDYELLFTVSPSRVTEIAKVFSFKVIGEVTPGSGKVQLIKNGREIKPKLSGFDHFKEGV
jgi:thiamine-monophosphate kinase